MLNLAKFIARHAVERAEQGWSSKGVGGWVSGDSTSRRTTGVLSWGHSTIWWRDVDTAGSRSIQRSFLENEKFHEYLQKTVLEFHIGVSI